MTQRHLTVRLRLGAAATALAMTTAACGGSSDDGDSADGGETITMGVIPGWTDETATTYLLKDVLEDNGYTVEVTELSDNAPMYTALANGDIDVLSSSWLERTHKSYMDEYGENLEDLGVYYEGATSFLAVPDYVDITSIDELPTRADEFGGRIVGIEPGAGLTEMTRDSVIPAYGLDDGFDLQLSSTAAMLTELQNATEAQEPIVVTMWKPFWANLAYPIKALEDPEGAYGEPENLHVLAREGFTEDQPEVAAMLENFTLTDEEFGSLENMVVNDFGEGEEAKAVAAWLEENPDYATTLASHLQG
ncbi:glycine betaine/proline transport system substrate-binding protein [Geodermatophilus telluris]|uniref:Glycine betaine/proline transport system substrate-binding protein n=1 Tax=Geodermatophilus telluris TaxID=1190417 RepID=A0A1G6QMF8_9ACTN|nr:glycine betaine ABC transporter substrate-binding protein [Geodermatophilus telluris]SDC92906.1 glycine betaine/proline transport system substrate-binding protein [Geodermatophilus telluris]